MKIVSFGFQKLSLLPLILVATLAHADVTGLGTGEAAGNSNGARPNCGNAIASAETNAQSDAETQCKALNETTAVRDSDWTVTVKIFNGYMCEYAAQATFSCETAPQASMKSNAMMTLSDACPDGYHWELGGGGHYGAYGACVPDGE